MTSRKETRMPYVAPLDGIRAVAILAVLLFHVWPEALPGGFIGVDVFFVLSGYLISSIILHDIREGSFSLKEFYLRRVQRLLPNVVVTVLVTLLLWKLLLPPGSDGQPAFHGLWTLFSLSNVYNWRYLGGYWGTDAATAPLTHFWSLGVEEQFYLFFPSFLLALARFQTSRIRLWLGVGAVLSFVACLYGTYTNQTPTFYLLPTRVWELLLGATLAAQLAAGSGEAGPRRILSDQARETMGWIGLGVILLGYIFIDEGLRFPGVISLAPTLGTVLVLLSIAGGNTRISRLLSKPFMVLVGKFSYSLYLWHWPLIVLGRLLAGLYGFPPLAGAALGGLAGVVLSWLAYIGVEQPLRNRGAGRGRRLAVIAAGFFGVAAYCVLVTVRPVAVDPQHRFDPLTASGKLFDAGRTALEQGKVGPNLSDVKFITPTAPTRDAWRTGGVIRPYGGERPQVVVFGSSHALMYARLIDDICREAKLTVAFLSVDAGTPAFFETTTNANFPSAKDAREFDDTRRKWLREWHPDAVLAIDRWDIRITTQPAFDTSMRSFLKEVSPLVGRVVFVAQVPVAEQGEKVNLRGYINWRWDQQKDQGPPRLGVDPREPFRQQVVAVAEAVAKDFPNLRVIRPDRKFYLEDGSIRYLDGRKFLYADDDHLSDIGTEQVRSLFEAAIAEARGSAPQVLTSR